MLFKLRFALVFFLLFFAGAAYAQGYSIDSAKGEQAFDVIEENMGQFKRMIGSSTGSSQEQLNDAYDGLRSLLDETLAHQRVGNRLEFTHDRFDVACQRSMRELKYAKRQVRIADLSKKKAKKMHKKLNRIEDSLQELCSQAQQIDAVMPEEVATGAPAVAAEQNTSVDINLTVEAPAVVAPSTTVVTPSPAVVAPSPAVVAPPTVVAPTVVVPEANLAPMPMDPSLFAAFMDRLSEASFSSDKLNLIRSASMGNYFTSSQVLQILNELSFSADKVKAAIMLYSCVVDANAWFLVYEAFSFQSDRQKVQQAVEHMTPAGYE